MKARTRKSNPMAPDKIDSNTVVPLSVLIASILAVIAVAGTGFGLQRAYYADKSSTKDQIANAVNTAVAATEQRRKEDQRVILDKLNELAETDREFRLEVARINTQLAVNSARIENGTAMRYTSQQADAVWREAERLNTWDSLQKYGFRRPDIWQITSPSSPFATGSTIRNASPD